MKVLYIMYIEENDFNSGSSARPQRMFKAFREAGHDVEVISGSIKYNSKKRKKDIISLIKRIKSGEKFDLCYVEPPSGLINRFNNFYEFNLWKQIKKSKIPMGIFYRDIYWKFYKDFDFNSIKYKLISILCSIELKKILRYFNIIFIPTLAMSKYLPKAKYVELPSACEEGIEIKKENTEIPTFIYVGGATYRYGTDLMLNSFKKVNETVKVNLNLICRPSEMPIIDEFLKTGTYPWLNIFHLSGKELNEIYNKSDYAIIPLRNIEYHSFCMPVKLFEYVSYEKPILTTCCKYIAEFVRNYDIGEIVEDNEEDMTKGILKLINGDYQKYKENLKYCKEKNMFSERVKTIINALIGENE